MLPRFLAFVPFFFLFYSAFAQLKPYQVNENFKKWDDGKLTWNDFQRQPLAVAPVGSDFIYSYHYQPEKIKSPDTNYIKLRAIFLFNRKESWAHDSVKTDLNLKYNQLFFNVLEWHRRTFENRFSESTQPLAVHDLLNDQLRLLRDETARLAVATRNGRHEIKVDSALSRSYQKLDSVKITDKLPSFRVKNFGYGVHMGYGQANLAGDLGNAFDKFSGLAFGVDFHYKAFTLFLTADAGSGKTTAENTGKYQWPDGVPINLTQFSAALGLPMLQTSHWRIVPFTGPARLILGPNRTADEQFKGQGFEKNTMAFGLQVDWKMRNTLSLILSGSDNLMYDYGLRTRFILYPVEKFGNLNGGVYNISMSLFVNSRFLKFR